MASSSTLVSQIKAQAQTLGFDTIGIARVSLPNPDIIPSSNSTTPDSVPFPLPKRLLNRLTHWLEQRFHGTMAWMERDPQRRPGADPPNHRVDTPDLARAAAVGSQSEVLPGGLRSTDR